MSRLSTRQRFTVQKRSNWLQNKDSSEHALPFFRLVEVPVARNVAADLGSASAPLAPGPAEGDSFDGERRDEANAAG